MGATRFVADTIFTGAVSGTAAALALAGCGLAENGHAAGPVNALSHLVWGDEAAAVDRPTLRHTLPGLALHGAAALTWAALFEALLGRQADRGHTAACLLGGLGVAGAAYLTDYYLLPARFAPGFEKRLSGWSVLAVYAALGLGLGAGGLLRR
jgi:hypothetical protein